jgi:hypothetical protein
MDRVEWWEEVLEPLLAKYRKKSNEWWLTQMGVDDLTTTGPIFLGGDHTWSKEDMELINTIANLPLPEKTIPEPEPSDSIDTEQAEALRKAMGRTKL